MRNIKKTLLAIAVVSVLGLGALSASSVLAQEAVEETNPMSTLVQKLADRFGLNASDVQEVFDEHHTQMQEERSAQMQSRLEERLAEAVTNDEITEDQKVLILAKHAELEAARQSQMQNMQNLSMEERKSAMETERTELEAWAKENGIDKDYLFGGFQIKFHGEGRKHMMFISE